MEKYYAVRVGRVPGIYTEWYDCLDQVYGFSGAEYKSFTERKKARRYLEGKIDPPDKGVDIDLTKLDTYAFIDGSFNIRKSKYGFGGFVYHRWKSDDGEAHDIKVIINGFGMDKEMLKMRNVAGEIFGCVLAVDYALSQGYKEIYIFHDYAGISKWPDKKWECNRPATKRYRHFINMARYYIDIHFIKVEAHTGVPENEEADKIAKHACGLIEYLQSEDGSLPHEVNIDMLKFDISRYPGIEKLPRKTTKNNKKQKNTAKKEG